MRNLGSDDASKILFSYLDNLFSDRDETICYYKNPLYSSGSRFKPGLVVVDKDFGVIIFKSYNFNKEQISKINEDFWIVNNQNVRNEIEDLEDYCYSFQNEINRPKLKLRDKVNFTAYIVFPFIEESIGIKDPSYDFQNILYKNFESKKIFEKIGIKTLNEDNWKKLLNVVQKLSPLTKERGISVQEPPNNLCEAIQLNENKLCVFDREQEEAAIRTPDGGVRIRGLAGTGKTIILTWKAAYLHYKYPDRNILYTFYTKSLYNQIKNLITQFYEKYCDKEPDWNKLNVFHAWGGTTKKGVYYNTCLKHNIRPQSMAGYRFTKNPFGTVCGQLSHQLKGKPSGEYDYVLIDEAQDMPLEFFRLIEIITNPPKRITIAYDDLQNTEEIEMPDFEDLFGYRAKKPLVKLEEDFILLKSYRNHRKILNLAVAVGFGLYSKGGPIQIIDKKDNWKAIEAVQQLHDVCQTDISFCITKY